MGLRYSHSLKYSYRNQLGILLEEKLELLITEFNLVRLGYSEV
jgi:hypothetical protein